MFLADHSDFLQNLLSFNIDKKLVFIICEFALSCCAFIQAINPSFALYFPSFFLVQRCECDMGIFHFQIFYMQLINSKSNSVEKNFLCIWEMFKTVIEVYILER